MLFRGNNWASSELGEFPISSSNLHSTPLQQLKKLVCIWNYEHAIHITSGVCFSEPLGTSICPTREKKVRPDAPETMKGALFSPKSPNFYPNDVRCTVTLDLPDNYKTVIWFQKFSLQRKNDKDRQCYADQLR